MKTLTIEETEKHFLAGDKIRENSQWKEGEYIYLDIDTLCVRDEKNKRIGNHLNFSLDSGNWELYTEPTNNIIEPIDVTKSWSDDVVLETINEIIAHINKQGQ